MPWSRPRWMFRAARSSLRWTDWWITNIYSMCPKLEPKWIYYVRSESIWTKIFISGKKEFLFSLFFLQLQIPPSLPATPPLCRLKRSLLSTFSIRRSASGHFWFIKPSTSFSQPFPSSLVMNVSGFSKKPFRCNSQKGCSPPFGNLSGPVPGNPDLFPLIHGRNSCCTCEWPNRKATYMTENEGH